MDGIIDEEDFFLLIQVLTLTNKSKVGENVFPALALILSVIQRFLLCIWLHAECFIHVKIVCSFPFAKNNDYPAFEFERLFHRLAAKI